MYLINKLKYIFLCALVVSCTTMHAMKRDRAEFLNQQAKTLLDRAPNLVLLCDEYATRAGRAKCYTCFNADDRMETTRLTATKTTNLERNVSFHAGDMNNNEVYFSEQEAQQLYQALETKYAQYALLNEVVFKRPLKKKRGKHVLTSDLL